MWPDQTEGVTIREGTNKGVTHSTQGQGPDEESKKNQTETDSQTGQFKNSSVI